MSATSTFKAAAVAALVAAAYMAGLSSAQTREPAPLLRVTPLFATGKTIMDEPIIYPTGTPAKLTAAVIAMPPGAETGWHTHRVPLTGIVLEGELTVDYGDKGQRTYKTGDAIAEAINISHNGRNSGTTPMRLFAVYIGAEGIEPTVAVQK